MRRHNVHNVSSTPSNTALHAENEKKFEEMMKLRSQQDQGIFSPVSSMSVANAVAVVTRIDTNQRTPTN